MITSKRAQSNRPAPCFLTSRSLPTHAYRRLTVNQPYKKSDVERVVQHIPGVASITNEIAVLPLSSQDDRLRLQVARAIYRDPALSRYAMGALPAIHIIVDNGKVTLTGEVNTAMEKHIAGIRAASAGLSFGPVVNNLIVENPPAKKS